MIVLGMSMRGVFVSDQCLPITLSELESDKSRWLANRLAPTFPR